MTDTTASENSKPLPYAHKGDLTQGPVRGHLLRMTWPMVWGLFAVIAVQLVDTYFISLLGDTDILAGFSFTFPVTMTISHLVFGINIALGSVTARLIGAQNIKDTKRVVLHGIFMAVTAASLIALLTFIFLEPLFFMLGADESTYPVIAAYMPLWLLSSVVLAIPVNANSAMRAAGDTFIPAIVMTTLAVVNAVLDPIFIFGYFGIPAMGVQGAALATIIGVLCSMAVALYFLICDKKLIATDGLYIDQLKDSFKRLAVIAIPAGIGNIIVPATSAVILAILAKYGPEAVAAFGVATRIEALSLLLVLALSLGMAPIIGQNWGAKKYKRVHQTIRLAIQFNFIWSALIALILIAFAEPIARAFSDDPAVIHFTVIFFWIVPVSYGFGNLVFGWSSAFNAIGMPQKAFIMIFVKCLIVTLPAVLIGGWLADVKGILFALTFSNFTTGLFFHILSKKNCLECEENDKKDDKQTQSP